MVRSSLVVMVIGIISKIMGTVRTSLIARSFGQGLETDAYGTAIKIAFFAMVFVNAGINVVMIPILSKVKNEEGQEEKEQFFSNFVNTINLVNLFFVLLTIFLAEPITRLTLPGGDPELIFWTTRLVKIMAPGLFLVGMVHSIGSYQQSEYLFAPMAAVGIVHNIIIFLYLGPLGTQASISGLAKITLLGYLFQVLFIGFFSRGLLKKHQWTVDFKDPNMKEFWVLMVPMIILGFADQISKFTTTILASFLDIGIITTINNANILFSAILSLIVPSIATVIYPTLSHAFSIGDHDTLQKVIKQGIEVLLLILLPVSVGAIVLSQTLVEIVFERGAFTAVDSLVTKNAFIFFAIGLTGHGLMRYFNRVFYAMKDTKTPMMVQILTIFLNIIGAIILVKIMDYRGLALAQGLVGILSSLLLFLILLLKTDIINLKEISKSFIKIVISSFLMGLVVFFVRNTLSAFLGDGFTHRVLLLIISSGLGVISYFIFVFLAKIDSMNYLMAKINEKLSRKKA